MVSTGIPAGFMYRPSNTRLLLLRILHRGVGQNGGSDPTSRYRCQFNRRLGSSMPEGKLQPGQRFIMPALRRRTPSTEQVLILWYGIGTEPYPGLVMKLIRTMVANNPAAIAHGGCG